MSDGLSMFLFGFGLGFSAMALLAFLLIQWWEGKTSVEAWKSTREMGERLIKRADDNIARIQKRQESVRQKHQQP